MRNLNWAINQTRIGPPKWRQNPRISTSLPAPARAMAAVESPAASPSDAAGTSPIASDSFVPPRLRFDAPPRRIHHLRRQFRTSFFPNNFLKGCKWSPDGSCFLTSSEDNTLRLFGLPFDGGEANASTLGGGEDPYFSTVTVSEAESVYDYCWYPFMAASDLTTCVFPSTTRDHPIHLWDASTGQVTAIIKKRIQKLFAGYNKSIRVFDLHRPGRDFEQYYTLQNKKEGQSVDCLQLDLMIRLQQYIAKIVWSPYMLHMDKLAVSLMFCFQKMEIIYILVGERIHIYCVGIFVTLSILYKLYRSVEYTNQRILFDIQPCGQHLGTGGQDGQVHIYDLQTGQWTSCFHAASDTVNGFSFHPYLPMAVSSSGHRRFSMPECSDEDNHLSDEENCISIFEFASLEFEEQALPKVDIC